MLILKLTLNPDPDLPLPRPCPDPDAAPESDPEPAAPVQGRPNLRRLSMAIGSGRCEIEPPQLKSAAKRARRSSADHPTDTRPSNGA